MEVRGLMERIVGLLEKTYYGDVRFERSSSTSIFKNRSKESIRTSSSLGLCIRIFSNDRWYYLGFNELNEEKIMNETKKLVNKLGRRKGNIYLQDPWKIDKEIKVKKNPDDISIDEKLDEVRRIFKQLIEDEKIVNASASISHTRSETIFMNTEGSELRQVLPYFSFIITAIAKEGRRVEHDYFVLAKQGGYELFTSLNEEEKIKEVVEGAKELLRAKIVKGGRYDVIVDPEVSGVIAHESFGHGCEADQVLRGRSYLAGLLNKKIISELVSIHDNGSLKNERGYIVFDDEGIKSSDTLIVENGVLKNFMHDRQTAAFMSCEVTGNARAQDFSKKVFVRMTNTYIEPGDWELSELIQDTKQGFLLIKAETGMEDPLGGNLQVITHKAIEIKNGKLGGIYKGVGISGKVLEFLSNVDAVTKDFEVKGSGCGKGHEDYVPVSTGGPYMRVRKAIIG